MHERITRRPKPVDLPKRFDFPTTTIIRQAEFLSRGGTRGEILFAHKKSERAPQATIVFEKKSLFPQPSEANKDITVSSVITLLRNGQRPSWSEIPAPVVRGVLEEVSKAKEIDVPASVMPGIWFLKPNEVLGENHKLHTLYEYARKAKTRGEIPPQVFLREQLGLEVTTDDVVKAVEKKVTLVWETIPSDAIAGLLQRVATHFDKPIFMIRPEELRDKFDFLNQNSLNSLIEYGITLSKGTEFGSIGALLQRAGIEVDHEAVADQMSAGERIQWDALPIATKRDLVLRYADKIGKPAFTFTTRDFKVPVDFLGNRSLGGLYSNAVEHIDPQEREGREVSVILLEKLGIRASIDDIQTLLSEDKQVPWDRVPEDTFYEMLDKASKERGRPLLALRPINFLGRFNFLGSQTLKSLMVNYPTADQANTIMKSLFTKAGIDAIDVGNMLREKKPFQWEIVPDAAALGILEQAADELDRPLSLVKLQLLEEPFETFNGASLKEMVYTLAPMTTRKNTRLDQIFQRFDIHINFDEVKIAYESDMHVNWKHVRPETVRRILEEAAKEREKPLRLLNNEDLKKPFRFLNEKNLFSGMYFSFERRLLEEPTRDQTVLQYMFEYAGIPLKISIEDFVHSAIYERGITFDEMMIEAERMDLDATTKTMRTLYTNAVAERVRTERSSNNGKH